MGSMSSKIAPSTQTPVGDSPHYNPFPPPTLRSYEQFQAIKQQYYATIDELSTHQKAADERTQRYDRDMQDVQVVLEEQQDERSCTPREPRRVELDKLYRKAWGRITAEYNEQMVEVDRKIDDLEKKRDGLGVKMKKMVVRLSETEKVEWLLRREEDGNEGCT